MANIKLISSKGRKKSKRRTRGRTAFIVIMIFLLGIAALVLSLGFYVRNLNTIYPNVWADGLKMSGMTYEEALQTLIDSGYESVADGVLVTIGFPNGSSFTITGEEAGFTLSAEDAAIAAFSFGRSGSFFENERSFVRALLTRTDLQDLSIATIDEDYIRGVVEEHTKRFNDALVDSAYQIRSDSITVVKGTGIEKADVNQVYNLTMTTLAKAIEEHTHLHAVYTPTASEVQDVDLTLLFERIYIEPVDSVYDPVNFRATESAMGVTFDMEAAEAMLRDAGIGTQIVIPLLRVEPEVDEEQIESMLFRDVLAERTTRILGSSNRLNNIVLSSSEINGTRLNPGDMFSFNGIVGRRTAARGYKEAGAYVGGRTVQEVGGGICQTSSTIYDCVLHADLEVIERRPHGMTVGYLPLGNDATIDWGSIDLKWRNSTDYPIRIEASVSGRDLTVRLIGTKLDDTYIKVRFERVSRTAFKIIEREDESVPAGQRIVDKDGSTGHVVDTFKDFYDGEDNLIKTTLVGRSVYFVQDRIILIPPKSAVDPGEGSPGEQGGQETPNPPTSPSPEPTDDPPPDTPDHPEVPQPPDQETEPPTDTERQDPDI